MFIDFVTTLRYCLFKNVMWNVTHTGLRRYAALKVSDRLNPPLGNGEWAWGSRLFDRRCIALAAKGVKRETKAEGSTPGPGLARHTFPVNGERRPRASIQSGREPTLGPRVVHYSLRCPSLFPLPSSLCCLPPSSLHHSLLAARCRSSHPSSSYFGGPLLLCYLLFCHCYYLHCYYVLVITGFRIWWCIISPLTYR